MPSDTPALEYVTNPLVPQRADPWCIQHDGFTYFTGSVPAYDRIELRRATTLQGLAFAEPRTVWRKHESGPMSFHIWAPELHFIDGRWYLYFAAGRAEAIWEIRMYVLENASANPLEGEWVEKGQIATQWDSFSLDATTFEHRGVRHLVWAQHDPTYGGNTSLYIAAMENPWTIRGEQICISRPELEWETQKYKVNEGAAFLRHANRLFLTYSASATDDRYCMGMLWADADSDLLAPQSWTKSPQPIFTTSETTRQYGPGHNSFTTAQDGSDVLIYHARSYREIQGDPLYDPNRHARAQRIEWSSDGMPIFGEPAPDGPLVIGGL